jgi:hypothetical protein
MAELALAKPPLRGVRQDSAQWLRPEQRVRVKHLKAKGGVLRHASVKQVHHGLGSLAGMCRQPRHSPVIWASQPKGEPSEEGQEGTHPSRGKREKQIG